MEDDISQRFESCDARLLEHDKQLHELSQKVGVLENASKDSYKRISSIEGQLVAITSKVDQLSADVGKMSKRIRSNGERDRRTQLIVIACLGLTVALFVYVVVADKASSKEILKTAADVSALASHLL